MSIIVTGGNGLIGRPTIESLQNLGYEAISASRSALLSGDSIYLDVNKPSTWPNILTCFPSRIIHLAWDNLDKMNESHHYITQLNNHLQFLTWCISKGISDITVAGTCLEYGSVEGELLETAHVSPTISYPLAKDLLRRALEHFTIQSNTVLKWARIFFIRASSGNEKGVFKIIKETALSNIKKVSLTKGDQIRDYISSNEAGEFLARLCIQNRITGIVNCCSGKPQTLRKVLEDYSAQWPELHLDFGMVPYRSYEPMAFWGNRKKMDSVLKEKIPHLSEDFVSIQEGVI